MKRDILLSTEEWTALVMMRTAQKRFYATRGSHQQAAHQEALLISVKLERAVDAIIERITKQNETPALPLD